AWSSADPRVRQTPLPMTPDLGNLLVLVLSVAVAFLLARWIAARLRTRKRKRTEQAEREGESRQVRRARQRRGR
ncbi:MAG TPA: hypothetical protein VGF26_14710, partial [Ramlibacter sp.]